MKYIIVFATILMMSAPTLLRAQPGGGLDDDPGVPIDGGASLLVGAAIVYGAKKLKDKKQGDK